MNILIKLRYIALLLALAGLAFSFGFYLSNKKIKTPKEGYIMFISNGSAIKPVLKKLKDDGIIDDDFLAYIAARIYFYNKIFYSGEFELTDGQTILSVFKKISKRHFRYRKFTIVEGETVLSIKEKLSAMKDLTGELQENIQEGYLLPETYSYKYGDSKQSIIKQATDAMEAFLSKNLSIDDSFYLKNKEEVLILASIVEKETGKPEERPLIAGVFKNRLLKGMKLESCPTVIYQILGGRFDLGRQLLYKDLQIQGDYNTYILPRLPKAPIANPSKEAILAVLHPESTDALYFVANGSGGHNFSSNYEDHSKLAREYIENRNAAKLEKK